MKILNKKDFEEKFIKNNLLEIPSFFKLIQEESGTDWQEMFKVYNCGTKFEVYTDEKSAEEVIKIAKSFQIDAQIIGYTTKQQAAKPRVIIQQNDTEYTY